MVRLLPAGLPWPSGHGPIEAQHRWGLQSTFETDFRGLRVTAPLKQFAPYNIIHSIANFRGLRVTAPLKLRILDCVVQLLYELPWPSGHGPIEAIKYISRTIFYVNFRGLRVTAPLKLYHLDWLGYSLLDFRGLRVTAPLKRAMVHFIQVISRILPWPSGHGPIEAGLPALSLLCPDVYFRGLRVTAPLKPPCVL